MTPRRAIPLARSSLWLLLLLCCGCTERKDEPRPAGAAPSIQLPHSPEQATQGDGGPAAPALEPRPEHSREDANLLAGEIDTGNRFQSTVSVITRVANGRGSGTQCSGLLVSPRLVLTAGHCVCKRRHQPGEEGRIWIDSSSCVAAASVRTAIYEPPRPEVEGSLTLRTYKGEVRPHPELQILLDAQGNVISTKADLALIRLDTPAGAEIASPLLTEVPVEEGQSIVMVSYGYDLDLGTLGGDRRINVYEVARPPAPGNERILFHQPQRHVYTGDSGGPCFRQNEQGFWLVGISSRALGATPACTSIQPYRAWIGNEVHRTSRPASAAPP